MYVCMYVCVKMCNMYIITNFLVCLFVCLFVCLCQSIVPVYWHAMGFPLDLKLAVILCSSPMLLTLDHYTHRESILHVSDKCDLDLGGGGFVYLLTLDK